MADTATTAHAPGPAHADAHGHGHNPNLAHHFDTPDQQIASGKLGMWLFLATEVLLFGGLFCAYFIYRSNNMEMFHYGHTFLDKKMGLINTIILLASSFTMAWAVNCSQKGNQLGLKIGLALTFLGGAGFMGIKYLEYSHKIHEGLVWGKHYHYDPAKHAHGGDLHAGDTRGAAEHAVPTSGPDPAGRRTPAVETPAHSADEPVESHPATPAPQPPAEPVASTPGVEKLEPSNVATAPRGPSGLAAPATAGHAPGGEQPFNVHIFFTVYFAMTGLHGIHVLAGMAVIAWLFVRTIKGHFGPDYYEPVDLGGLYWHLVDLIWIYLFPLLYLIE